MRADALVELAKLTQLTYRGLTQFGPASPRSDRQPFAARRVQ
jgi:hypothetical protein